MARITLTIDNGPDAEETPRVLDALDRRGVKAHFFVIGRRLARPGGAELLREVVTHGHKVGNHTFSHSVPFGRNPSPSAVQDEVERTEDLLGELAEAPPLFRPFGGGGRLDSDLLSPALIAHLGERGYTCALWNAVPRDWETDQWVGRALAQIQALPWSVVVVHDVVPGNAARIDEFIARALDRGYEFDTRIAPECLPIVGGEIVGDIEPYIGEPPSGRGSGASGRVRLGGPAAGVS